MTKRKKYGKRITGERNLMNFLGGFIMREPVTLLQKEDKRKAALSIFNLSKTRLTLALKAI